MSKKAEDITEMLVKFVANQGTMGITDIEDKVDEALTKAKEEERESTIT